MKITIKIIILLAFVLAAITGVVVFAKTRVAPPMKTPETNQYSAALTQSLAGYDSIVSSGKSDYGVLCMKYADLDDFLVLTESEKLATVDEIDKGRMRLDNAHGEQVADRAMAIFSSPVWNSEEISALLEDIARLDRHRLKNGRRSVDEKISTRFADIRKIWSSYKAALALSRSTNYVSIADASSKISRASQYRNEDYLSNNRALCEALRQLPRKISESHYAQVSAKVAALANYRSYTLDYYNNTLIPRADEAIKGYKNTKIYGTGKTDIKPLELRGRQYVDNAMDYYYSAAQ